LAVVCSFSFILPHRFSLEPVVSVKNLPARQQGPGSGSVMLAATAWCWMPARMLYQPGHRSYRPRCVPPSVHTFVP
jgi:hypothetical protein